MDFFLPIFSRDWKVDLLDLPLIHSVYKIPLIIFAYIYFVLICGPRFMKNKPPYSLKTFIQLYNIVQIVMNTWMVYSFFEEGIIMRELFCPFPLENDYIKMKNIKLLWCYFLLKILDYVDTVIFVLRKKNNQVSGLHVFHHVSVLLITWGFLKNPLTTPIVLICILNNTVHAIMYTYYFLAACGPNIQKTIMSMKRWITIIQMVQLCFAILYSSQNFIPNCKIVPHWIISLFILILLSNFYLFYNFYKKSYTKSKKIS